ncbi:MAG: SAM-dependent DNA methyltransferase [Gammaproteobacteria bacterium]|nr:MAG: SAM-dependent DNA methyltransferase [Gammaproteobacteria bacterium]
MMERKRRKAEFGDFQTPINLARQVCGLIAQTGFRPATILEPTCGVGSFLRASLEAFPDATHVLGFEIYPEYVGQARSAVRPLARLHTNVEIHQSDFFHTDWSTIIERMPEPLLVIGNPPWVTNAELSSLGSANTPTKSNFDNLRGIDALTGKSNFDISEWMLRKSIEWLNGKDGLLAMLCKTTVARKVLVYAWKKEMEVASASLYRLDAQRYFGAAVDACLLLMRTRLGGRSRECQVYSSLHVEKSTGQSINVIDVFGWRDRMLVSNIHSYEKWKHLAGNGLKGWRSGIKHDASKVFELRQDNGHLINGFGEKVDIEPEMLFPLLKSSDLAARRLPQRWLVVPQRTVGEDTSRLKTEAPKTWDYLMAHAHHLDKRRSSIYKNRARFSVFGVGPYSFASWKVAISGLYKKFEFVQVPPFQGRPVVFDDTCYFFPCQSEEECQMLHEMVTSEPAREFLSALVFWDAKRPITARLLNLLDLAALARVVGNENDVTQMLAERQVVQYTQGMHQLLLFRENVAGYNDK